MKNAKQVLQQNGIYIFKKGVVTMLKKILDIVLMEAIVFLSGAAVIALGIGYCSAATINAGNLVITLLFLAAGAAAAVLAVRWKKRLDEESGR